MKDQQAIDLHNTRYMLKEAERKVLFLTGCASFGSGDGMDGSCQTCYHEDRTQWERCNAFGHAYNEYRAKIIKEEQSICQPTEVEDFDF